MKKIEYDYDNIGGVHSLYAIPMNSYLRVRHDYIYNHDILELKNMDDIISIPVYADETFSFSEEQGNDEGGVYYSTTIEGVIPKHSPENEEIIHELERGQWLVLSTDHNGINRLSGNEDVQMMFSRTDSTGKTSSSANQVAFKFACKSAEPSVTLYNDDIENI